MALTIEINGTDRTSFLKIDSCQIRRQLNGRSDLDCVIEEKLLGYRPTVFDAIVIKEGATKPFSGIVWSADQIAYPGTHALQFRLRCLDHNYIPDKRMITQDYQNQTLKQIVEHIVATFLNGEGVTTVNVPTGPTITQKLRFNHNSVKQAFDKIETITGYQWFIDADKDLHFSQFTSNPAPFGLTDTSANWYDLILKRTLDHYRNRQYERTEYQLSPTYTETFQGDGSSTFFATRFIITARPTVTVNGVSKTVGQIGVDHIGKDFSYSLNGFGISNQDHPILQSTDTLVVTYQSLFTNVWMSEDLAEIAVRGRWEAVEEQRNIDSLNTLEALALGRLRQSIPVPIIIEFATNTSGLEPGHRISIQNTDHQINSTFLIESIDYHWRHSRTGDFFEHRVRCSNAERFGRPPEIFERIVEMARIGPDPAEAADSGPTYLSEVTLAAPTTQITSPTQNPKAKEQLFLRITIDGTAGRRITWAAQFEPDTPVDINNTAGAVNILHFVAGNNSKWKAVAVR